MMWVWLKMVVAVGVMLLPGGFPLLLAYITTRTLWSRWRQAQQSALVEGRSVSLWDVVTSLHFKDLVREARSAL